MRATSKGARELEQQAREFSNPLLPKKGKVVIEISAAILADLVERVEMLERHAQERARAEIDLYEKRKGG